ncbi:MAG: hypothetical protein HY562_08970 [Ignavibacteriales bacterium]|nr:hypothetical protein [Ignavibacteriales bacterium]
MTTKPPPSIAEYPAESLEKLAYSVVSDIATREPNDRNRLGYHVWAWLKERTGTLEQAVTNSGSRTELPLGEVYKIIARRLEEHGVKLV